MTTTSPPQPPTQARPHFRFSSAEGMSLCRTILAKHFPYDPHDVQIEAISKLLDQVDVFAILRTGMGKTSIISMYMRVMISIVADPSLCPEAAPKFRTNPCVIVILPTKYLEHQMADIMSEAGLKTLVINADTIHNAHIEAPSQDLWKNAVTGPQVILMAPEQLISKGCSVLVNHSDFSSRVCGLVVDEAHLLNTWGVAFRKSYKQIGWVRARLPDVVLLALSATMREEDLPPVCEFLGLHSGSFHLLKQSNSRPEIQIIFRHLKSGIAGKRFPELNWTLSEKRRTIIFCRTINLGFRVYEYLCEKGKETNPDIANHIRMYNALNWPTYNADTRHMLQTDPHCRIAIGTDTMSVGVDIRNVEDVIVLDEPENIDELIQKFGRVGRDRAQVQHPRAILYTSSKTPEIAQTIVNGAVSTKKASDTSSTAMDLSMARLHLAPCKPKEIDRQYGNGIDPPCHCKGCANLVPLPNRPCNCSGCIPRAVDELQQPAKPAAPSITSENVVPKARRISKAMRTHGTEILLQFRLKVWSSADESQTSFFPPSVFLPDSEIKLILDRFSLISATNDVQTLLISNKHLNGHHSLLYETIEILRKDFKKIAADRKEELRLKKKKELEAVASEEGSDESDDEMSGTESEIDFSAEEDEIQPAATTSQWRIIKPSNTS